MFGHENHVSCQRARLRRSASGPPFTGTAPTRSYVCAGCPVRGVSPRGWAHSRVAPSLAMSNGVAAERGSQPAQRDELAHSHTVPIGDGVSPLTIDNPPNATTGILESLQRP